MPNRPDEGLITLLAGFSRRMGHPKQHVRLGRSTFLEHLLSTVGTLSPALEPRIFIGQEGDDRSRHLVESAGGIWLTNPRPEDGPLSSIRIALSRLPPSHGFFLWPVDHPLVAASTVRQLLEAVGRRPDQVIVPSHAMRRGHPARFPARARADLQCGPLETGAKYVLLQHPDWIHHVETDDPWTTRNLNTPELLALAEAFLAREGT